MKKSSFIQEAVGLMSPAHDITARCIRTVAGSFGIWGDVFQVAKALQGARLAGPGFPPADRNP